MLADLDVVPVPGSLEFIEAAALRAVVLVILEDDSDIAVRERSGNREYVCVASRAINRDCKFVVVGLCYTLRKSRRFILGDVRRVPRTLPQGAVIFIP